MFPLYDSTPRRTFPFINYAIIVLNIYMFWRTITAPDPGSFITQFSFIPQQFSFINPLSYIPLFTSLFLHGSFLHILSNMWFLHIFGDNVEDRFGHFKYLIFYLLGGLIATLAQYFIDSSSLIPIIGASGAISAVAGAYFVLFKRSTVKTLVFLFIIVTIIDIPAWLFLGYWFALQLFAGVGSLSTIALQTGGVAVFAHIGGFAFGYLVAKRFYSVEEGVIV